MKVGFFMFATPYTAAPATVARTAEAVGFESFWLCEHPIVPVHPHTQNPAREDGKIPEHFTTIPDPFISLAGAAAVTKKLKMGTSICLAAQRNPLLLNRTTQHSYTQAASCEIASSELAFASRASTAADTSGV
jgi:alkanesulfonate monooxygenase SsuD/methylene tetrahydromethanopterin reductase-like flavin-dependent oxidoreductase (luciferase family)